MVKVNTSIVVVDTETTGVGPEDKICELAVVELSATKATGQPLKLQVLRTHESLIDPQQHIPFPAQAVHHISDEAVASAPTLVEYFALVNLDLAEALAGADTLVWVGHNAQFDQRINNLARDFVGMRPKLLTLDSLRLIKHLRLPVESAKLDSLRLEWKVPRVGDAHRALTDCLETLWILNNKIFPLHPEATMEDWAAFSMAPLWVDTCPISEKWRGKPMVEVDPGFLRWMIDKTDMDDETKETARAVLRGQRTNPPVGSPVGKGASL